jgi:hypothetical protein
MMPHDTVIVEVRPMAQTSQKRKISLWFDHDDLTALHKLSDKTGAPVAELIRRAVAAYLKKAGS